MVPSQQKYDATPNQIIPSAFNERNIPDEKPQKSESTVYAVIFIVVSILIAAVSLIPGLAALGTLAIVGALAGVLMGILSLRESL